MLYSEKVMDHFQNPRNVGKMEDADGIGEVGNARCGDIMRMYIKVDDGIITDVKFNTFGCGSAIATSSIATEMIKGKPIEEALTLSNQAVVEALDGLPAYKISGEKGDMYGFCDTYCYVSYAFANSANGFVHIQLVAPKEGWKNDDGSAFRPTVDELSSMIESTYTRTRQ